MRAASRVRPSTTTPAAPRARDAVHRSPPHRALERDLVERFDDYCQEQRYATRSEAVRQLLRETLTSHAWSADAEDAAATLTIVYDHHRTSLMERLLELQHRHAEMVVSTMHVHL